MKKINLVLACAALSVLAVGCQKEDNPIDPQVIVQPQDDAYMQISYSINGGQPITQNVSNLQDIMALIQRVMSNSQKSDSIRFTNESVTVVNAIKEVIRFESQDPDEIKKWSAVMIEKGYMVDVYYDEKKEVYVAIAKI